MTEYLPFGMGALLKGAMQKILIISRVLKVRNYLTIRGRKL